MAWPLLPGALSGEGLISNSNHRCIVTDAATATFVHLSFDVSTFRRMGVVKRRYIRSSYCKLYRFGATPTARPSHKFTKTGIVSLCTCKSEHPSYVEYTVISVSNVHTYVQYM